MVSVVPQGTNFIQRTETALFTDGQQYITGVSWTAKPGFKIWETAETQTDVHVWCEEVSVSFMCTVESHFVVTC